MKKKILFIAPDYYGFNEVVYDGLKKYSDCEVVHINTTLPYKYKNFLERLQNFFLKTFKKKNLKILKQGEHIRRLLEKHKPYDLLIANRPDTLQDQDFDLALSLSKRKVNLLWDSLEKIPSQQKYCDHFDTCFSFDPADCKHYGFKPITNFYFAKNVDLIENKWDVALLMTYDNRIHDAIKLFRYFEQNHIKAKAKIFTYKSTTIKEELPSNMEIIHKIIPFEDSYNYYLDSKAILDLAHPVQKGLSFRPFEAIGLKKKIITTSGNITDFDLYQPKNTAILGDLNHITIASDFFTSEYIELDDSIKDKYFIKNWVNTVVS